MRELPEYYERQQRRRAEARSYDHAGDRRRRRRGRRRARPRPARRELRRAPAAASASAATNAASASGTHHEADERRHDRDCRAWRAACCSSPPARPRRYPRRVRADTAAGFASNTPSAPQRAQDRQAGARGRESQHQAPEQALAGRHRPWRQRAVELRCDVTMQVHRARVDAASPPRRWRCGSGRRRAPPPAHRRESRADSSGAGAAKSRVVRSLRVLGGDAGERQAERVRARAGSDAAAERGKHLRHRGARFAPRCSLSSR